jgi:fructokinase
MDFRVNGSIWLDKSLGLSVTCAFVMVISVHDSAMLGAIFGECLVDDFGDSQRLGGAPFNVAQHLCGLGVPAIFISQVGDDIHGKNILEHMRQWQMPLSGLEVSETLPTGRVEVLPDPIEGHRFAILPLQAYDEIPWPHNFPEHIQWLYHGSLALREDSISRQTLRKLASISDRRFLDINLRAPWWAPDLLRPLLTGSSILKCNVDELETLLAVYTLRSGPARQDKMRVFAEYFSLESILLTCGPEGSAYWDRKDFYEAAAEPVKNLVDTVGAGDAFSAAWLWSLWRGESPELRLHRAGELAAAVCTLKGATPDNLDFYEPFSSRWTQGE